MQSKSKNKIVVLAFQLCVIANSVFGSDAQLYKLSKAVMLGFFLVMIGAILFRGYKLRAGKQLALPIVFAVYIFASILWSHNQTVAMAWFSTVLQLVVLLIFTYLAMMDGAEVKDYLDALYISGWGLAAFALVRYGGLGNYLKIMEEGMRMGGEIANENNFGLTFSSAAISAAYYIIIRKRKIDIVSIAVFTFFALSSGSKKATLLIIAGFFAIAFVHFGIIKIYKTVLLGAVVLVLAWYVLQLPIFETVYERLESFFSGNQGVSDMARKNMIDFGMDMFRNKPILGYGLYNFSEFYPSHQYSHNNFVELLVSGGLIGFVLYYAMYFASLLMILLCKPKGQKLSEQHLMLLVWLIIDLVFGYGMVQIYEKTSFILLGVALGATERDHILLLQARGECR